MFVLFGTIAVLIISILQIGLFEKCKVNKKSRGAKAVRIISPSGRV